MKLLNFNIYRLRLLFLLNLSRSFRKSSFCLIGKIIQYFSIISGFLLLNLSFCTDSSKTKLGRGSFPASEFPDKLEWLNVKKPMKLVEFKGRVLVLFFWTGSNLKSLEILNNFRSFEIEHQDKIKVIAIHSPRFKGESNLEYVRSSIIKNRIDLTVIHDPNFLIWRTYGINNWNSLLVIGEDSKVIGRYSIDKNLLRIDPIFEKLLNFDISETDYNAKDESTFLEKNKNPESILSFPEKIIVDDYGKDMYVSDSNHNRILIINRQNGFIKDVIGNGQIGFDNGKFNQSTFNYPTGLVLLDKNLFIVDNKNHSLRKVDLEKKIVTLFSGTGKKGDEIVQNGFAPVTSFSFPYDITREGSTLYLSNTGFNQFIKIDPSSGKIESLFSETKDINYNPEFFSKVGMTFYRETIFTTDSSSGSLKSINADFPSKVKILIGNKAMNYGDTDGDQNVARLQFPKGIYAKDDQVYIADTLNNKIKVYDLKKKVLKTLAGTGQKGSKNGKFLESTFNEPSNLYLYNSEIYVTDSNNNCIRVLDLNKSVVTTFYINASPEFIIENKKKITPLKETYPYKSIIISPEILSLKLKLNISKKYIWDPNAYFYFKIISSNPETLNFQNNDIRYFENFTGETIFYPKEFKEGNTEITIDSIIYFCDRENQSLCYFKKFKISSIIKLIPGGKDKPELNLKVSISQKQENN